MADNILTKQEALQLLEKEVLTNQQYVTGDMPTAEDQHIFYWIMKFDLTKEITSDNFPRLFSWHMLISRFIESIRLSWPDATVDTSTIQKVLAALKQETDVDAEARREKQKWDNYVPKGERRPLDEFYDVDNVPNERIGDPVDLYGDGHMIKYVVREPTTKFDRPIESEDIVHYMHETRYDNG